MKFDMNILHRLPSGVAAAMLYPEMISGDKLDLIYADDFPLWRDLFGIKNSIAGESHYAVFPGLAIQWISEHRKLCINGQGTRTEKPLSFVNPHTGEEIWILYSISPAGDRGENGLYPALFIANVVTEQVRAQQELKRLSEIDILTGAYNRHWFNQMEADGTSAHTGLLYVDLDRFKKINDTLGHFAGDHVLQVVAHRMMAIADTELIRVGGDEFVVITKEWILSDLADEILAAIAIPVAFNGAEYRVGASVGYVARYCLSPEEPCTLFRMRDYADYAMYQAKKIFGNHALGWSPGMATDQMRLSLVNRFFRSALLSEDQFQVYYQPICALNDLSNILGFEALLRWNSPELGDVRPSEFIPEAEKDAGLISELGRWVLETVVNQLDQWRSCRIWPNIAVNVSMWELEQSDFVPTLKSICQSRNVLPSQISIEVTERVVASNWLAAQEAIDQLNDLSVRIKIDDFGTGQNASLDQILRLTLNDVKIDRSLIPVTARDKNKIAICSSVVALTNEMGLTAIAEGIESESQLGLLRTIGVGYGQGYFLGRPAPAHEAEKLLG